MTSTLACLFADALQTVLRMHTIHIAENRYRAGYRLEWPKSARNRKRRATMFDARPFDQSPARSTIRTVAP